MTEFAAATRSVVIEREMPHAPENVRRALTESPLIEEWLMKNDFQGASREGCGRALRWGGRIARGHTSWDERSLPAPH
jgi:uncharacterized protein YndB with AHSA1/START domain